MKRIISILCALCAFLVAEVADEISISKTFIQSGTAKPALLFANIHIQSSAKLRNIGELTDKNRGAITTTLNAIIQEVKESEICTGGSYSINPIISYRDEKRITIGQNVDFALQCKFVGDDLARYNALLKKINDAVKKNPLLSLPQPALESQITQVEINAKKEALFEEFLTKSGEITAHYSKILGKTCAVKQISTKDASSVQVPRFAMAKAAMNATAEADSTHTKAPIADDAEVEIMINLTLNCK